MTFSKFTIASLVVGIGLFTASCSHRLIGTWDVQRFETVIPGGKPSALSNIGSIEFQKRGRGEKDLNYSIVGRSKQDTEPFRWEWISDEYITIDGRYSDFAKTWIIIENKRKFQKWKSTDGGNSVQTIELRKR